MGDTARYSTLHGFTELEKRSRPVRKSARYSLLALFAGCFWLSLLYYILAGYHARMTKNGRWTASIQFACRNGNGGRS
jgi:hypothetical protein